MDERMDGRTDGQTENLPILQDFVPYWGRCPACPHENQEESRAGQGNGWCLWATLTVLWWLAIRLMIRTYDMVQGSNEFEFPPPSHPLCDLHRYSRVCHSHYFGQGGLCNNCHVWDNNLYWAICRLNLYNNEISSRKWSKTVNSVDTTYLGSLSHTTFCTDP